MERYFYNNTSVNFYRKMAQFENLGELVKNTIFVA